MHSSQILCDYNKLSYSIIISQNRNFSRKKEQFLQRIYSKTASIAENFNGEKFDRKPKF